APPQAEGPVPVARAVDEIELWLNSAATRWQRNRNREVACAGVEIGREGLADTMQGAAPGGERDGLVGSARLIHICLLSIALSRVSQKMATLGPGHSGPRQRRGSPSFYLTNGRADCWTAPTNWRGCRSPLCEVEGRRQRRGEGENLRCRAHAQEEADSQ